MQPKSFMSRRKAVIRLALLISALTLIGLVSRLLSGSAGWLDDFIEYWSAGHLNLQGFNPYDLVSMGAVQQALGRSDTLMMYNPPHALAIAMPFALAPYMAARLGWLILNLVAIGVSVWWIWQIYDRSRMRPLSALVLTLLFPPTLFALVIGQISPLILLGLAGFLRYERADRPWIAGAFLALVLVKPQWIYLLWPALLVWSITARQAKILLAACLTLMAGTGIAMSFNPAVLRQYLELMLTAGPTRYLPPTLGGMLRAVFGAEHVWLQFLPMAFGLAWLIYFLARRKGSVDWQEHLPALVLASALTSPFGWTFDQVVLLVVLLPAAGLLLAAKGVPARPWLIAAGIILIGAGFVWVDLTAWWYAPAWCLWYWFVMRADGASKTRTKMTATSSS